MKKEPMDIESNIHQLQKVNNLQASDVAQKFKARKSAEDIFVSFQGA